MTKHESQEPARDDEQTSAQEEAPVKKPRKKREQIILADGGPLIKVSPAIRNNLVTEVRIVGK